MRITLAISLASVALCAAPLAGADMTVWDGVYTATQAARGRAGYQLHCKACHGDDLSGGDDGAEQVPPLRRENFGVSRRELNNLYMFMSESMPKDDPASLDDMAYVDILSYVLQQNDFPAGSTALTPDPDLLRSIKIVKKP